MYAVIKDGGRELRVGEGEFVDLDHRAGLSEGDEIELGPVLLLASDDGVKVGAPVVEGAVVKATVAAQVKGPKIVTYKYKRRKGYHRKKGHRQPHTRVRITGITG